LNSPEYPWRRFISSSLLEKLSVFSLSHLWGALHNRPAQSNAHWTGLVPMASASEASQSGIQRHTPPARKKHPSSRRAHIFPRAWEREDADGIGIGGPDSQIPRPLPSAKSIRIARRLDRSAKRGAERPFSCSRGGLPSKKDLSASPRFASFGRDDRRAHCGHRHAGHHASRRAEHLLWAMAFAIP